jgi:hypothetical protein
MCTVIGLLTKQPFLFAKYPAGLLVIKSFCHLYIRYRPFHGEFIFLTHAKYITTAFCFFYLPCYGTTR